MGASKRQIERNEELSYDAIDEEYFYQKHLEETYYELLEQ